MEMGAAASKHIIVNPIPKLYERNQQQRSKAKSTQSRELRRGCVYFQHQI